MSTTIRADEVEDGDVINIHGEPLVFSKTNDYRISHTDETVTYTSKLGGYVNRSEITIGIEDGYFYLTKDYPVELVSRRPEFEGSVNVDSFQTQLYNAWEAGAETRNREWAQAAAQVFQQDYTPVPVTPNPYEKKSAE